MPSDHLLELARNAQRFAYAPYSGFAVGAALETKSGLVFTGCNVENISYGLTICAERNAVSAAVAAGELEYSQIVIVADSDEPVSPCGACRQVLAEFRDDLPIRSFSRSGEEFASNLSELLPRAKTGILDRTHPS